MTVGELIKKLNEYPNDMKVCVGIDIFEKIDLTVLEVGSTISDYDRVYLEEPYLSIW